MGKSGTLKILVFSVFLWGNLSVSVGAQENKTASQKIGEVKKDYYREQIAGFFNAIDRARIQFSQFKDDKKIGSGYIEFDKYGQKGNFITIYTSIGKRECLIKGSSLDNLEFHDLYLDEKRKVKAPEIVKLMFGKDNDVKSLLKKSFVTEKYGKIVCILKYDDFTGYHKILLCFNAKPFTLRFWRVVNRGEKASYIKVDDIRYNYKNS